MKNPILLIVVMCVFSFSITFGQKGSLVLSFSASDFYSGNSLFIDSVFVENLSKDCDTIVYGPQPELLLSWVTGVNEFSNQDGIQIEQNFPNPFSGSTKCKIRLSDKKNIKLTLANSTGSKIASIEKTLPKGIHSFIIKTPSGGTYFLTISSGGNSGTLKLISKKGSSQNRANIFYSGAANSGKDFKAINQTGVFVFKPGDVLKMTAYSYGYEDGVKEGTPEDDIEYAYELIPNLLTFTGDTTSGYVPFITNFYPTTNLPNISQYLWDFGDGDTSTMQLPYHTYLTNDTWYTVTLTVTSNGDEYSTQRMNYIHAFADTIPVNFIADITYGIAPQTIQFIGYAPSSNGTWQWSFGDGGTAQFVQNPVYTYTNTGVFTVSAQYMDNNGTITIIKENYIHIDFCPVTVTDVDGNVYHNVKINNQCWMKENLNTGVRLDNGVYPTDNNIIEKLCYDDDDSMCDEYGGLYYWNELMNWTGIEGSQGICPDGFHIPTLAEWSSLFNQYGGPENAASALKEQGTDHWSSNYGLNSSGFTAFGGGDCYYDNGFSHYEYLKYDGTFYSSTKSFYNLPYKITIYNNIEEIHISGFIINSSVRCIKDQ